MKKINLIVPRRLEERKERYKKMCYKVIRDYVESGSKETLWLGGYPEETLPPILKTVGALDLMDSQIKYLPDGLNIKGDWLDLRGSQIEEIPKNLKVKGEIWLNDTPLSRKYNAEELEIMIYDRGGKITNRGYVSI